MEIKDDEILSSARDDHDGARHHPRSRVRLICRYSTNFHGIGCTRVLPSMSRTSSATPTPEIQTPILEIRMARVDARYSAAPLSRLHASHVLQSLDAIHRTKEIVLGTVTTDVVLHGVARRLCDLPVGWTPQQGSLAGGPVHTIRKAKRSKSCFLDA